ncbi:putative transporter small subunit [Acinetobacter sp. TGL-Y2]|nr:putative transporter small subunit [Acinetobacter sp. TGL-Y2]
MTPNLLTLYLMLWPTLAMGVLTILCVSLYQDYKLAKENGDDLV